MDRSNTYACVHANTHAQPDTWIRTHILFVARNALHQMCTAALFARWVHVHSCVCVCVCFVIYSVYTIKYESAPFSKYNNLMHCKNIAWKLHHELNSSASANALASPLPPMAVSHAHRQCNSSFRGKASIEMYVQHTRKKKMLITQYRRSRSVCVCGRHSIHLLLLLFVACRLKVTTVSDYDKIIIKIVVYMRYTSAK